MGYLIIFIFVILALAFSAAIFQSSSKIEAEQKQGQQLAKLENFSSDISYNGGSLGSGVAIDASRFKFAIIGQSLPPVVFDFSQLIAVDIVKDGVSREQTNRGSQAVGATMGGLLLGPAGLLLGGLSGSKNRSEKFKRLSLKIYTSDLLKPMHEIVFFDSVNAVSADSILIKSAVDTMDQWHGRFRTILASSEQSERDCAFKSENVGLYKLHLLTNGQNKIATIKILREVTGAGLAEAKIISESLPAVIVSNMNEKQITEVGQQFQNIGAGIKIEPC
jgi:ribosomal protein L7/L12